jgi:gamma-glutamylcyclotransferase (GGCT)/AIG2-like uncharacterized protein YtfP
METPSSLQLFVYSSLRKGFHLEAYQYLVKYFTFISMGKVKGILIDSGTEPVAAPTDKETFIKGELYKLNNKEDFSWVFGQLDEYEGIVAAQDEKILYKRELTKVYKDDGSVTEAWIFWFEGDVSGKPAIDTEDALEYVKSRSL